MNIALFALMVTVILANYGVKDRTGDLEDNLAGIESDIKSEIDAIKMARAEWAFLNQADRIQVLSKEHLSLAPIDTSQIVSADELVSLVAVRKRVEPREQVDPKYMTVGDIIEAYEAAPNFRFEEVQ